MLLAADGFGLDSICVCTICNVCVGGVFGLRKQVEEGGGMDREEKEGEGREEEGIG